MNTNKIVGKLLILSLIIILSLQAVVVNKLDGISSSNIVYSGNLPISQTSADSLFFTYYSAKNATQQQDIKKYPLVIVVGSPGSSAQYLNLAGMGPITLKPDMITTQNTNSITNYANVMFIDLLGSGFSFTTNTSSLPTKYQDYGVYLKFAIDSFKKQSELGKSAKLVLVGEGPFLRAIPGLTDIENILGIVHMSAWPELCAVGKYYGTAGVDLKIFGNAERISIESTYSSCCNNVKTSKPLEAHNCYESVLNFVESKTKNINLYNVNLGSNLTEHVSTIQYYFSQSSIVSAFKAPKTKLFDTQSSWVNDKTFADLGVNKTTLLSRFMKDMLDIKHWYVTGDKDYISWKQSLRFWLENELSFVESSNFTKLKLDEITYKNQTIGYGKQVNQLKYTQIINAGHYPFYDKTQIFSSLMQDWIGTLKQKPLQLKKKISTE